MEASPKAVRGAAAIRSWRSPAGGRAPSRPTVAVSPLVGGKAIKGPAAKMAAELGVEATPVSIAAHYDGVIGGWVYDEADPDASDPLARPGGLFLPPHNVRRDG